MVFENEINIYNPDAIANEFRTQSTQITAVQGKISAIISDSQIQELQSGGVNMFSRLVSAEMSITGISTQVSSLQQKDGQLESQISTLSQTASSISAEVSSVKNNYAKKAQIILAINNTTQESQTVINADHISLAGKRINLTSDDIEINSTYFKVNKNGEITATKGTFSGTLSAATGTFSGSLSAATGTFAGSLSAATGTFKGQLSAATGTFAGSLSAATGTFAGSLSAATGSFSGSVTASSGTIGGFSIGSDLLKSTYSSDYAQIRSGAQSGLNPGVLCGFSTAGHTGSTAQLYSGMLLFHKTASESEARAGNKTAAYFYCSNHGLELWLKSGNEFIFCDEGATVFDYSSSDNLFWFNKNVRFYNDMVVYGNKNRLVSTVDYGERLLYSYETPTPFFGDIGEGVIGEDGKCYIQIDSVFSETVTLSQYQVFLQKYGSGEAYVSERTAACFIVEGTPGLKFAWEIKAKQVDGDQLRLKEDLINMNIDGIDYQSRLMEHIDELRETRSYVA